MIEHIADDRDLDLDVELPVLDVAPSHVSPRSLVALGAIVALVRFVFSAGRVVPQLVPDGFATFGMARFLSGGHWNMYYAPTWRPGYATIIAPLFWITKDPVWVLRGALFVSALLGGVGAIWLALIVERLVEVSASVCVFVSGVVALTPSSINASSYLWAEPLVTVCSLAVLWYLMRYFAKPCARTGIAAIAWAVAGFTSHSRLLPLVIVATILVAGQALAARAWARSVTFVVVAAGLSAASVYYADWVVSKVWTIPSSENTAGDLFHRLLRPLDVLDAAAGQVWYQLVATGLIFGLGVVWLVRQSMHPQRSTVRRDARLVLLLTAVLMSVSFAFMSGRTRADYIIYGRYNDAVVWPVVAAGLAWLVCAGWGATARSRMRTVGAVAVVSVELALVLNQLHHTQLRERPLGAMVPGIVPMMNVLRTAQPVAVTALSLAIATVLLLVVSTRRARQRAIAISFAALLLVPGALLVRRDRVENGEVTGLKPITQAEGLLPKGAPIAFDFQLPQDGVPIPLETQLVYALYYQWYLPDHEFTTPDALQVLPTRYLFEVADHPAIEARGAQKIWSNPELWAALWRDGTP